jgi:hypothetical protein
MTEGEYAIMAQVERAPGRAYHGRAWLRSIASYHMYIRQLSEYRGVAGTQHETLMILGVICTRSCKFCGTKSGRPLPPDAAGNRDGGTGSKRQCPQHSASSLRAREDLPDSGTAHWLRPIRRIKD